MVTRRIELSIIDVTSSVSNWYSSPLYSGLESHATLEFSQSYRISERDVAYDCSISWPHSLNFGPRVFVAARAASNYYKTVSQLQ